MKRKQAEVGGIKISILLNHHRYSFSEVFIIEDCSNTEPLYVLLVFRQKQELANHSYTSVRGARIAFTREFGATQFNDGIHPEWSHFYAPEPQWLAKKWSSANA